MSTSQKIYFRKPARILLKTPSLLDLRFKSSSTSRCKNRHRVISVFAFVRGRGLEPPSLSAQTPQACASTSFATRALENLPEYPRVRFSYLPAGRSPAIAIRRRRAIIIAAFPLLSMLSRFSSVYGTSKLRR